MENGIRRGLLLFIDEAEAFLGKRSSPGMSEDTRNALNALLYNTGSASRRLMMVLATNRAELSDFPTRRGVKFLEEVSLMAECSAVAALPCGVHRQYKPLHPPPCP